MNLADYREDYQRGALDRAALDANPLVQFESWFRAATSEKSQSRWRKISIALYKLWSAICNHRPPDMNAMTLATVDKNGQPSSRTVLLKSVDERGFIFFTNYDSRKGQELAGNPYGALQFHWVELERVVRIEGLVEKVSSEESDTYFHSRPLDSRIGAWASPQSQVISGRGVLVANAAKYGAKFLLQPPRPPHWGGYRLKPEQWQFWQGRKSRLHDRLRYTQARTGSDGKALWLRERLAP